MLCLFWRPNDGVGQSQARQQGMEYITTKNRLTNSCKPVFNLIKVRLE